MKPFQRKNKKMNDDIKEEKKDIEKNNEEDKVNEPDEINKDIESVESEVKVEEVKKTNIKKSSKKTLCRIIVAHPKYFVINKDGEIITVEKKNNYIKGEEVYY